MTLQESLQSLQESPGVSQRHPWTSLFRFKETLLGLSGDSMTLSSLSRQSPESLAWPPRGVADGCLNPFLPNPLLASIPASFQWGPFGTSQHSVPPGSPIGAPIGDPDGPPRFLTRTHAPVSDQPKLCGCHWGRSPPVPGVYHLTRLPQSFGDDLERPADGVLRQPRLPLIPIFLPLVLPNPPKVAAVKG
jgi:hypothetical protein